jgi:alanine racemase
MRMQNPLLEIDLAAICENYRSLALAAPGATPAGVVKCDAYGLGADAVGRALQEREGCRVFFVAYSEEGAALRNALGGEAEIFVFNGPFPETLSTYRDCKLTPVVNTLEQAALWRAEMNGAPAALHIDTGMHRLGLPPGDISRLLSSGALNVSLIMSHLACASDATHQMNSRQLQLFSDIARQFPNARRSLSSSGGAVIGEGFAFDLTRLGVGMYGVSPLDSGAAPMKPVARLTAPVIAVHEIRAGETVGYGATYAADRDSILATVSLGYGDGFPRSGSNRSAAYVAGAVCPVAGRISMDLIVLDVTAAARLEVGDRAEFFGPNLLIDNAAASCGTIGYELLTAIGGLARPRKGLGARVLRSYLWNGAPVGPEITGAEGI